MESFEVVVEHHRTSRRCWRVQRVGTAGDLRIVGQPIVVVIGITGYRKGRRYRYRDRRC